MDNKETVEEFVSSMADAPILIRSNGIKLGNVFDKSEDALVSINSFIIELWKQNIFVKEIVLEEDRAYFEQVIDGDKTYYKVVERGING